MPYGNFKYLPRKTVADLVFMIKHLTSLKIQIMMDINMDLIQWFIHFSIKRL